LLQPYTKSTFAICAYILALDIETRLIMGVHVLVQALVAGNLKKLIFLLFFVLTLSQFLKGMFALGVKGGIRKMNLV